jgi:2,3-bisphosphoglycerate-dependent phosphoglycerate mutase
MGDSTLILLRHGESQWNALNLFTGWVDVDLTDKGRAEAVRAGQLIAALDHQPDVLYTSLMRRAITTAHLALDAADLLWIPVHRDWRLNERHYGSLQGETRGAMIARYGNAQIVQWRRSYADVPPFLEDGDPRWSEQLARLSMVPHDRQPRAESLRQAAERVAPVWDELMVPGLLAGHNLLVVAHTSAIRGLARVIEHLSDEQCEAFRIATAIPRIYLLGDDLQVRDKIDLNEGLGSSLRYWGNRLKPRGLGWA